MSTEPVQPEIETLAVEIEAALKDRDCELYEQTEFARSFKALWDSHFDTPPARNWYTTLKSMYCKGLSELEMYDAVMVTASQDKADNPYNYFCGVAHTKIKALPADLAGRISRDRRFTLTASDLGEVGK